VRKPFGYGSFPGSGFAHQYRVVLGAPGKDLQDPPDLFVPADYRVELTTVGQLVQVPGIFVKRIIGFFRALRSNATAFSEFLNGCLQVFFRYPLVFEYLCNLAF